jgi:hypothetical protein
MRSWSAFPALVLLVAVVGLPTPVRAAEDNSWVAYASDPEVYAKAWTSVHWASSIERVLMWGGHSHNYKGNNSLRAFDPVGNRWEILWPNTWGGSGCKATPEGGVQNRDNHASFYVPRLGKQGEFWVLRGAYTTTSHPDCKGVRGTNWGGRFDIATRAWVKVANSPAEFAEGVIKDFAFNRFLGASAHDWCAEIDTGVVFGGGASNLLQLIEPNPPGPEPYRFWKGVPPGSPPPRSQVQNSGVCAGEHFYLTGGAQQGYKVRLQDLWRLHVPTRTWKRLADAPNARYGSTLTYDQHRHVLVRAFGKDGEPTRTTLVYHIDGDRWEDVTDTMRLARDSRPWLKTHAPGVYSPTVKQHLYIQAGRNPDGGPGGWPYQHTDGYTYSTRERPRAESRSRSAIKEEEHGAASGPSPLGRLVRLAGAQPVLAQLKPATDAIQIPVNTWVARKLPGRGKAPTGGKHMRLTHNPHDGRIYFLGGDYSGPGGVQSGRNEVYSYSIKDDDWRLEWPYCGPAGTVQPAHPDQVGWVYDSTRRLFWMLPGYLGQDVGRCKDAGSELVRGKIMTFDPATRTWTVPGVPLPFKTIGTHLFAQYDEKTDTIIRFIYVNRAAVALYDIKKTAWTTRNLGVDANLGKEYTALDPEKRVIYVIQPRKAKLYRYDIDKQHLAEIADAPEGSGVSNTMPVWDSANRVLIFPQHLNTSHIHMHVYHPDSSTWKRDIPVLNPENHEIRGTNAVYDPYQNVILIMGAKGNETVGNPYLFLYRYGNGSGKTARGPEGSSR